MLDDFLNKITMYRLVLYYLICLLAIAVVFGFIGILPFGGINLILTTFLFVVFCWITNFIFAKTFEATANVESVYISALILALIISPVKSLHDIPFVFWASVLAMSSKFIVAWKNKHLFNPVALAVILPSIFLGRSATWWIGNLPMFLPVLLGGLLIVKKIRRSDMVLAFFAAAFLTTLAVNFNSNVSPISLIQKTFFVSPILFFAFVMLTEPLTTPPTKNLRIIYGAITGFLFSPQINLAGLFTTPESALLIGNVFSYIVSPKKRFMLSLNHIEKLTADTYDFVFNRGEGFDFTPGQYMEWTLEHEKPDSRGNRRYFTIASSPTENEVRIGVKFYNPASSFKKMMLALTPGMKISVSQLAGDFTLPSNPSEKLVFLAGGIGITPFRSMIKYLIDKNEKRDIVLLYADKSSEDVVYKDVFDQAQQNLGIKTVYSVGRFTPDSIISQVPDFKERVFYISGPHTMVESFEKALSEIGIPRSKIKTDYFPGFS